jgi:AsmA protein
VITGEFVANNRSGLSVGGTLNANALEMSTLLADLADISRFTGKATAKLSFLGGGQSVDAIMKSLKGSGSMNVGSGTITGFDLDKLFRGSTGGGTTVFDSMSATMQIAGGVVSNEDLLMELPSVLAKGKGTIGLGAQDINYTFVPQLRSETDNGIAVPVRIKGPWSSPKIWPDLEAVIDQNFSEEKKQLEEKLENKVKDKLGVTTEEGQSVEDALKQKLEKKVGDKLLNLLGGD